jgi:uncharacterized protein YneF (UPF0154 family)
VPTIIQPTKKRGRSILMLVGIGLFLVVAVIGVVLYVSMYLPKTQKVTMADLPEINKQAGRFVFKKNIAGAVNVYDTAIRDADGTVTAGNLYLQKASVELNGNQLDTALTDAVEANKRLASEGTSNMVATVYAAKGNHVQAAKYYHEAAGRVKADRRSGESKEYYEYLATQEEKAQ